VTILAQPYDPNKNQTKHFEDGFALAILLRCSENPEWRLVSRAWQFFRAFFLMRTLDCIFFSALLTVTLLAQAFGSSCPSGSNTHSEFSSGLVAVDLIHLFLAGCLLLAGNCLPYLPSTIVLANKDTWKALGFSGSLFLALGFHLPLLRIP